MLEGFKDNDSAVRTEFQELSLSTQTHRILLCRRSHDPCHEGFRREIDEQGIRLLFKNAHTVFPKYQLVMRGIKV